MSDIRTGWNERLKHVKWPFDEQPKVQPKGLKPREGFSDNYGRHRHCSACRANIISEVYAPCSKHKP